MKSEYLFCVDSDGCAMDTMTYKHKLFFGPLAADLFEVNDRDSFLEEWNRVNLYSKTRGINRFLGLVRGLEFAGVPEINHLKNWVETTNSLSNQSLEQAIKENPQPDLKRALDWSCRVNEAIKDYASPVLSFIGVEQCLAKLDKLGKVYVVSSANKEAVENEWADQNLLEFVTDVYCQDRGKKEDVLRQLVESGADPSKVLMIGDSPGDLVAAEMNHIPFYPILVGQERKSWSNLFEVIADDFVQDRFTMDRELKLKEEFWNNLDD